jgi:hypothetical protein
VYQGHSHQGKNTHRGLEQPLQKKRTQCLMATLVRGQTLIRVPGAAETPLAGKGNQWLMATLVREKAFMQFGDASWSDCGEEGKKATCAKEANGCIVPTARAENAFMGLPIRCRPRRQTLAAAARRPRPFRRPRPSRRRRRYDIQTKLWAKRAHLIHYLLSEANVERLAGCFGDG